VEQFILRFKPKFVAGGGGRWLIMLTYMYVYASGKLKLTF
jgi:hypothetical protein